MAEKKLLASLSDAQKQCYVIFKTLVKQTVEPYSAISSYCLKTTLFWTLERIPKIIWDDPIHGLASGFFGLLDMLIHFLAGWRIPQYFIPESDLAVHGPPEHIPPAGCGDWWHPRQRPPGGTGALRFQYEFQGVGARPLCFGLHPTMQRRRTFPCRTDDNRPRARRDSPTRPKRGKKCDPRRLRPRSALTRLRRQSCGGLQDRVGGPPQNAPKRAPGETPAGHNATTTGRRAHHPAR